MELTNFGKTRLKDLNTRGWALLLGTFALITGLMSTWAHVLAWTSSSRIGERFVASATALMVGFGSFYALGTLLGLIGQPIADPQLSPVVPDPEEDLWIETVRQIEQHGITRTIRRIDQN